MNDDLDTRISEAERAAAELSRLEQAAAELPALQAQRANRQREQQARAAFDAAVEAGLLALGQYKAAVGPFREDFDAWVGVGRELAERLRHLETGVHSAAAVLAGAVATAQRSGVPVTNVAALWVQLGWTDVPPALPNRDDGRVFRQLDFDELLAGVLSQLANVRAYEPTTGIRGAGVKV